jgi:hypothetical protein
MKHLIKKIPWKSMLIIPLLISVLLLKVDKISAQLPDCSTGISMYGVFVDTLGSGHVDSTEIRPINYSTGVIGPLMGGRRYFIRRSTRYGASSLGVDGVTNRFYLMTQMSSSMAKDIIAIDPTAATHAAAVTVIGTTPSSLDNYHFVKLAMAPTGGYGYAIGVLRDSGIAGYTASNYNPLIRFNTCVTAGCATAVLLGYLPGTGNMYKTELFNGDIAFDAFGNLFFATAAFRVVGSIPRYTDTRLFRINVEDIPLSAGTGTIPMNFIADFNNLDSTVVNGIAFDPLGNMFFATRRFTAVQTSPAGHSDSELYTASFAGTATKIAGFNTTTTMPDKSVADLASCYFPNSVLAKNKLQLTGRLEMGKANLKWEVNNNNMVNYYEIQKSIDGNNFTTIASITPSSNIQSIAAFNYRDTQNELRENTFYRVRQIMKNDLRFYSNITQIHYVNKMNLVGGFSPNPFIDHFNFVVQLKSKKQVGVKVTDQAGRVVYRNQFAGEPGENKFSVKDIYALNKGIYVVEISADNEIIREKLIRQ